MVAKIITVLAFAVIIMFLFGCGGRAQPYGEDLWIGLQHMEKSR